MRPDPHAPLTLADIPGPRPLPLVGNLRDVDRDDTFGGFVRQTAEYGPLFKVVLPDGMLLLASGPEVVAELTDAARFGKKVTGGLKHLQQGPGGSGLFLADSDDPLWRRAHEILMAPFSLPAMRGYLPQMTELAGQLIDKWSRTNRGEEVDVPGDMTRLTLDTIALCGFGYRLNSFYREAPHPFTAAMFGLLDDAEDRMRQLPVQTRLKVRAQRRLEENRALVTDVVDRIVADRRAAGDDADTGDLLGRMLTGVSRTDGQGLPDANIRDQCIVFLTAGYETTSSLLSFALYFLIKNPHVATRARAEVDEVLGSTASPTFEQVHRLRYVRQILDETLRMWPTAPAVPLTPHADTTLAGYAIPAGTDIAVLPQALHRSTAIWGPDAAEFNPDHTDPDHMSQLPPGAYVPFGMGMRACIGRQFALQEAQLVLGMLIQRFEFVDHLDYRLRTASTLTVKPVDFHLLVRPRQGMRVDPTAPPAATPTRPPTDPAGTPRAAPHSKPLSVLFGSNLGTAESVAARLAQEGTERGFAVTLGALDDHVDDLPRAGAMIIVSGTYNGTPPDNAAAFCRWISGAAPDAADGVPYTVFGCGSTEWASTYQAVPTLLDTQLATHGARRVRYRGAADAAGDFDAGYRAWHDGLWADLAEALQLPRDVATTAPTGPHLTVTLTNRQLTNPVIVSYRAQPARVQQNRELLTGDGRRSVRHVEITLPAGMSYAAGDHLGVLPHNSVDLVRRVLTRFGLDAGQYVTIIPTSGGHTHLPVDEPAPLLAVLGSCVELQDVAARDDIATLARFTDDPDQRAALEALTGDDAYRSQVLQPNRSLLDLSETYPACAIPFADYLDLLPPLRPRYYSISSSPLERPDRCSITAGVLNAPARSGTGGFAGVCSTYLGELPTAGTVFAFVRPPTIAFRPPADPQRPMIMIGAGTGLAPFRGFLQERAFQRARGVAVARSLLFFGCRHRDADLLYAEELRAYEEQGLVRLEAAFSRPGTGRGRYVQDAVLSCADEVWAAMGAGAVVFVCGNATTMAPGVRDALITVFAAKTGAGEADAQAWLAGLRTTDRFVEDIWGN